MVRFGAKKVNTCSPFFLAQISGVVSCDSSEAFPTHSNTCSLFFLAQISGVASCDSSEPYPTLSNTCSSFLLHSPGEAATNITRSRSLIYLFPQVLQPKFPTHSNTCSLYVQLPRVLAKQQPYHILQTTCSFYDILLFSFCADRSVARCVTFTENSQCRHYSPWSRNEAFPTHSKTSCRNRRIIPFRTPAHHFIINTKLGIRCYPSLESALHSAGIIN